MPQTILLDGNTKKYEIYDVRMNNNNSMKWGWLLCACKRIEQIYVYAYSKTLHAKIKWNRKCSEISPQSLVGIQEISPTMQSNEAHVFKRYDYNFVKSMDSLWVKMKKRTD